MTWWPKTKSCNKTRNNSRNNRIMKLTSASNKKKINVFMWMKKIGKKIILLEKHV